MNNLLTDLPIDSRIYLLLGLHCLIGSIAMGVAVQKGRQIWVWWLFGLIGGTAALLAALLLPAKQLLDTEATNAGRATK